MLLLAALSLVSHHPADAQVQPASAALPWGSARTALDAVAPHLDADEPIARFTDPICATSSGLPPQVGRIIVDRIGAVAAAAGLRVGRAGCAPNVFVLFVLDGKATMRRLFETNAPVVAGQSVRDMNRLIAESAPARAWSETEIRSRDGDRPTYSPRQAPRLPVATSSHLALQIRRDILSSTVLIDRDAAAGLSLKQIADYAAMRALTGARPDGGLGRRSVLSLFTHPNAGPPEEATAFDKGYLRGLYDGRADLPYAIKRAAIVDRIARFEAAGPR
jgi:hypothetical protein